MIGNKYMAEELAKNFQARVSALKKAKASNFSDIKKEASKISEDEAADYLVDSSEDGAEEKVSHGLDKKIEHHSDDNNCSYCGYAHDNNAACDSMSEVSGYAKDKVCKACKSRKCKCSESRDNAISQRNFDNNSFQADDAAFDKESKRIENELSKVAKSLRAKGAVSAAKVVETEAAQIKNASQAKNNKLTVERDIASLVDDKAKYVVAELGKIASELRGSGNGFAADMVAITASEIKEEAIVKAAGKYQVVAELVKMAKDSYTEGDRMTGDIIQATILNIKKG